MRMEYTVNIYFYFLYTGTMAEPTHRLYDKQTLGKGCLNPCFLLNSILVNRCRPPLLLALPVAGKTLSRSECSVWAYML